MNIVIASSEIVPFAKTGGLADVVGAIPRFLEKRGAKVTLFLPYYREVKKHEKEGKCEKFKDTKKIISVPIRDVTVHGKLLKSTIKGTNVVVYAIANDHYYDRDNLYGDNGDYEDNCERFTFFSRGILEALKTLTLKPDVIHCNDWQSALIPVYLNTLYANEGFFKDTATLFTIHNLGYQGLFWHWDLPITGLDWSFFNFEQLEFYGKINFLKGGIVFADAVSTVSKRYAEEIMTPEFGCGLEDVLLTRKNDLYGILNGIDVDVWNPEVDSLIPAQYSAKDLSGKAKNKKELQKLNKLPQKSAIPLIGVITRLADQKGLDIMSEAIENILEEDVQFVLLGTGMEKYHALFETIGKRYPKKTGINLKFDNKLAHLIEAGADMFLMPSKYEPCGLNQMYSLTYGTVPVVRETGGLADTIVNYTPERVKKGVANGFSFKEYSSTALLTAVRNALEVYNKDKQAWAKLIQIGMKQDWSWNRSAKEYYELYEKIRQS